MARHEKKVHNIVRGGVGAAKATAKKTPRPVPNLIPIPKGTRQPRQDEEDEEEVVEVMSQKDMNDICAKSVNSALKDFASLFGSEDVFKDSGKVGDGEEAAMDVDKGEEGLNFRGCSRWRHPAVRVRTFGLFL